MERQARKDRSVIGDPEFLASDVDVRKKGALRVGGKVLGIVAGAGLLAFGPGATEGNVDPNPPAVVANRLDDAPKASLDNGGLTPEDIALSEDIAADPERQAGDEENMSRHIQDVHSGMPENMKETK